MPRADNLKSQKEKSVVGSFFSSMKNDISNTINFSKLSAGEQFEHKAKTAVTIARNKDNAAYYGGNDKPRAAAVRYSPPPPPITSIEDYYNMLKQPVAPLPSLLTKKSPNYSKPSYGDVSTSSARREGGEVRSFFQSTSTGYV